MAALLRINATSGTAVNTGKIHIMAEVVVVCIK